MLNHATTHSRDRCLPYMKRFHKKYQNSPIPYVLIIGAIIILTFIYSSQFLLTNSDFKNVELNFHSYSIEHEIPSIKLQIDGKEIFKNDCLEVSFDTLLTKLNKGKHIIEILTSDEKYKKTDTLIIDDLRDQYVISVGYKLTDQLKKNLVNRNIDSKFSDSNSIDSIEIDKYRLELKRRIDQQFDSMQLDQFFTLNIYNKSKIVIE